MSVTPAWIEAVKVVAVLAFVVGCTPPVEPTEEELRAAVELDYSSRGNQAGQPNELRVDGPFSGMTAGVVEVKKIGCIPAQGKPGFICDYRMGVRLDYHSNTGMADSHSQAANQLLQWMTGGQPVVENMTSRFVKSKGVWIRLKDD